jgi:hypothetical protein
VSDLPAINRSGVPSELAARQAEFLERAREAGDDGQEFTVVGTEAHPGGLMRGWRFDARVALSGRSFLLTTEGLWCSAVRTGEASFGWGVLGEDDLGEAIEPWADELVRALRTAMP